MKINLKMQIKIHVFLKFQLVHRFNNKRTSVKIYSQFTKMWMGHER